jgi:branched-chain amino acid transport system permease protein
VTVGGLELLYHHSLIGRAFLAIAEDNHAARALGLPERGLRIASFGLAGAIGGLAGFASGQLMLAFFVNGSLFSFYGFIAVALGGLGNNRGAVICGLALGVIQQAANFVAGGGMASALVYALFIVAMLLAPQGVFNAAKPRRV